ncbi:unnamed protein product [Linum tenue]|uniref:Taste receptor type 2 n=1 Tax=Linum tenue TaxID=586396 RepID=A0AAV0IFM2_9ROSI|nr:unnamed protein product [Linum tenue]
MALLATSLKTLFLAVCCFVLANWIRIFCTVGLPVRELLTPWMRAIFTDFYINILAVALRSIIDLSSLYQLWIVYKEANFVSSAIWIFLLLTLGRYDVRVLMFLFAFTIYSVASCGYVFIQLLKLSPQASAQDPVYHVLLRPEHKNQEQQKEVHSQVVVARVVFIILGCLMIATVIYSIAIYGSPFHEGVFTPWMAALLIDLHGNVLVLSVWVAYKETSWLSASVWIVLLICPGGVATCAFISKQLFQLSSQDPIYLLLLKNNGRATKVPLLSSV